MSSQVGQHSFLLSAGLGSGAVLGSGTSGTIINGEAIKRNVNSSLRRFFTSLDALRPHCVAFL